MTFEEVVARLGIVRYTGTARLEISRGGQSLVVKEESVIEQGLHGSFRVAQKDKRGEPTREGIYHNGIFFIRNGTGEMRVQGIVKDQHLRMRQEAWEPLATFTGYFGKRAGVEATGATSFEGRPAQGYRFVLLDGPDIVPGGKDKAKKPLLLDGLLLVDAQTAVPLKVEMTAKLDVPQKKADAEPGHIDATLRASLVTIEGVEIKPKKFIPTIKRHPTDLDPLAFLEGDVRTSTVIGGKKKATKPPPPAAIPPPPEPSAEPEAKPEEKTSKRKKRRRKKKSKKKSP